MRGRPPLPTEGRQRKRERGEARERGETREGKGREEERKRKKREEGSEGQLRHKLVAALSQAV